MGYAVPIQWWLIFLPQWVGHAGHLVLVLFVLTSVVSKQAGARGDKRKLGHAAEFQPTSSCVTQYGLTALQQHTVLSSWSVPVVLRRINWCTSSWGLSLLQQHPLA
jgi:hypothetical protein